MTKVCGFKRIIWLATLLLTILCMAACSDVESTDGDQKKASSGAEIVRINILTAEENPDHVWKLEWPKYYYAGTEVKMLRHVNMQISKEDREYLLKYCNEHKDGKPEDGDFLCFIDVSTIDGKVHSGASMFLYGSYPEGFDRFAQVINDACGGDREYLATNGRAAKITEDYFTAITGLTDDDVKDGTVSELIDHLAINNLLQLSAFLKNRYVDDIAKNYDLCRLLEYQIVSAPSTEEEWHAYSVRLAEALGSGGEVTKGKAKYDEQEWYEIKAGNGKSVRVFRTEGLGKFIPQRAGDVDWWYESYRIYEDTQGPTSEFFGFNAFDFTYSNDHKYAVAVESESDKEKVFFREIALAAKSLDAR